MKKSIRSLMILGSLGILYSFGPIRPAFADPTITPIGDQVVLSLLSHVTAVEEFTTHGYAKTQFLDGIVEFGHYKNDYLVAIDGGVSNNATADGAGKLASTWGIHIHAISGLNNLLNINPSLGSLLDKLEVTPRVSYDMDVHHLVYGYTIGAEIPFQ